MIKISKNKLISKNKPDYLKMANELLKSVSKETDFETTTKGYVTNSYLRNILDLSRKVDNIDEFFLRIGYMTAKNLSNEISENIDFYKNLKEMVDPQKFNMEMITELMEYTIMKFYVMKKLEG
ncbi:MAG: hypothetical protein ACTSQG_07250 [Promethearchaeota archaeon]